MKINHFHFKKSLVVICCVLFFSLGFQKSAKSGTAIEYGLISALVSVAAITALSAMGDSLDSMFSTIGSKLESASTGTETETEEAESADQNDDYVTAMTHMAKVKGSLTSIVSIMDAVIKHGERFVPDAVLELKKSRDNYQSALNLSAEAVDILNQIISGEPCGNGQIDLGEECDPGSDKTGSLLCQFGQHCSGSCTCVGNPIIRR